MKKRGLIGSAMIEFMLVVPVFLILVSGLIETSVMLYDKAIILDASREGARYGVVIRSGGYATLANVQAWTSSYIGNSLISFGGSPSATVSAAASAEDPDLGDTLTVTVTYQYTGILFFVNLGGQYSLSSSTVMSYE